MPPARGQATPLGKSSGSRIELRAPFTCIALAIRPLTTIPGRAASPRSPRLPCIVDPPTMEVVQRPFPRRATTTRTPRHVCIVISRTLSGLALFGDCDFAAACSALLSASFKPRSLRVPLCPSEYCLVQELVEPCTPCKPPKTSRGSRTRTGKWSI